PRARLEVRARVRHLRATRATRAVRATSRSAAPRGVAAHAGNAASHTLDRAPDTGGSTDATRAEPHGPAARGAQDPRATRGVTAASEGRSRHPEPKQTRRTPGARSHQPTVRGAVKRFQAQSEPLRQRSSASTRILQ